MDGTRVAVSSRGTRLDAALITAATWSWVISGAAFWTLARSRDVMLPHLPAALWVLPGELWRAAPPAVIAVVALAPVAAAWLARRPATRRWRPLVIAGLVLILGVTAVWGGALLLLT